MDPSSRHQARERAVTLLYEAELKGCRPTEVVDDLAMAPDPYTASLIATVETRATEIDRLIADAAIG